MKSKVFIGYFVSKKGYKYSRYRLRSDEDAKSRLGIIRKYTDKDGIFHSPCCNGGSKLGNNGRFKTYIYFGYIRKITDIVPFHIKRSSQNIGVKNFKKS